MNDGASALIESVRAGSRRALARAITLVESTRAEHRQLADELLTLAQPFAGHSIRIGISGAPGVGKSTFIEAFGLHALEHAHRVAVLAVDPSSRITGGSILGDKTRMPELSVSENAFVRPSPAGESLGGVARRTRETLMLCEAAGYDLNIVETVGVGQSEVAVAGMTDLFLLLLPPAGGDDLQGIKRGIMELSDIVVVNKTDGELAAAAGRAAADYTNALRLMRPRTAGWDSRVLTCSSLHGTGVPEVWEVVQEYVRHVRATGTLSLRRTEQAGQWFWSELTELLLSRLRCEPRVAELLPELESKVRAGVLSPAKAAAAVMDRFLREDHSDQ